MKILVTGSKGFIGKNLIAELNNRGYQEIFEFNRSTNLSLLDSFCKEAEFVFHLAGVNRPKNEEEYIEGNANFTSYLFDILKKQKSTSPVLISSSTQAELDNTYGTSKKLSEDIAFTYEQETGSKVLVYRFPNVFGKWCKPNYNSVVATFCHNVANDLPIQVHAPEKELNLVYIDDLIEELINALEGNENRLGNYCEVKPTYNVTVEEVAKEITSFKESRSNLSIPDVSQPLVKKLYSTYISYVSEDQFKYELKMNIDNRGSFTEFIKTVDRGQVSINISKPGINKGNHWHHTKTEKFLVVSGKGVIRIRKVDSDKVTEYFVSGEKLEVIDIPTGYTHNIENLGESDMVTVMWVNEIFNPEKPDTYYLEV